MNLFTSHSSWIRVPGSRKDRVSKRKVETDGGRNMISTSGIHIYTCAFVCTTNIHVNLNMRTYIDIHIHVHILTRRRALSSGEERERKKERDIYKHTNTSMCTLTYMHALNSGRERREIER